jgi:TPR repeat protein
MELEESIIGDLYMVGAMVPKDLKKAFEFYQSSALSGNSRGKYNLATCYLNGSGVEMNKEKAIELLTELANTGNKGAINSLSSILKLMNYYKK